MFVAQQGGRLIAEHRDAMLGDAPQLAVCDSVSHGSLLGRDIAVPGYSCDAAAG
jgi:hypothetical protein